MTTINGWTELDDRAVAYARALAMDAVQKVGNGHPGTAMSLAPVAYYFSAIFAMIQLIHSGLAAIASYFHVATPLSLSTPSSSLAAMGSRWRICNRSAPGVRSHRAILNLVTPLELRQQLDHWVLALQLQLAWRWQHDTSVDY
jgi:hypothetical protein